MTLKNVSLLNFELYVLYRVNDLAYPVDQMEVVLDFCQMSVVLPQLDMDWSWESQVVLSWEHSQTNACRQTHPGTTYSRLQNSADLVDPTTGPSPWLLGSQSESASENTVRAGYGI